MIRKSFRVAASVTVGAAALATIAAILGSGGSSPSGTAAVPAASVTVTATPTAVATIQVPGPTVTVTVTKSRAAAAVAKSAPVVPVAAVTTPSQDTAAQTVSEGQAVSQAQNYLSLGAGFSRLGLIDQLEFDKFSSSDSAYAADHVGADWNTQAALKAKSYMSLGTGFSYGSMVDQLEFDKFTPSQAAYGAKSVGL